MSRAADTHTWQSIDAAAKRLGRVPGHIRKLCGRWAATGHARQVAGGGRKWHWEIRDDAGLYERGRPIASASTARARVGDLSIWIEGNCLIEIREGTLIIRPFGTHVSNGVSAAVESGSRAVRRPYKTGSNARRPASA